MSIGMNWKKVPRKKDAENLKRKTEGPLYSKLFSCKFPTMMTFCTSNDALFMRMVLSSNVRVTFLRHAYDSYLEQKYCIDFLFHSH